MASKNKLIREWSKILVDTSILISLFLSEDESASDDTVLFVRKLIDFLENNPNEKKGTKVDRVFMVSSITISELLSKENDSEKIKKVLNVLNSNNVEFIDFDLATSLRFNSLLYPHLSNKELNKRAAAYGFKTHEFMMAREWITRDFMILCSGIEYGADVVLTLDKSTMYPSANEINLFCALPFPELFETFGTSILKYKPEEVETFLNE